MYVDGFNLYYGCLQDSAWKWLDLRALCERVLPRNTIHRIKYFTALVQTRPGSDPQKTQRQLTYLRALQMISGLEIFRGQFLSHPRRMALARPRPKGPRTVEVISTEEKGSDVNLATHLLLDGFQGDYELAVVISNDSDLAYPVSVVKRELKLRIGVIAPVLDPDPRPNRAGRPPRRPSVQLNRAAHFTKPMDAAALAASQFPATLTDQHGTIRKPAGW
ncbi:MAG TPA: NYN domain-containing protein [Chloroflexota bacterium]